MEVDQATGNCHNWPLGPDAGKCKTGMDDASPMDFRGFRIVSSVFAGDSIDRVYSNSAGTFRQKGCLRIQKNLYSMYALKQKLL
jgi:hypothetical protein